MISRTKRRWLLPVIIAAVLLCVFFISSKLGSPLSAKAQPKSNTEGEILVIPVQLERDSFGLAMVDTVGQTMWIYEINTRGPAHNRLRLLAARSWQYDRLLQQYNTAEPKPAQIKIMLEDLGQLQQKQDKQKRPGLDTNILEIATPNDNNLGQ